MFADFGGPNDKALREDIVPQFTRKYGGHVSLVQGLSFDILSKLKASKGNPSIDVWQMTDASVQQAINLGLVEPVNKKTIPNMRDLDPSAIHKMPGGYFLDMSLTSLPIIYNKKYIKKPPTSWRDLARPEYKNHVILPNVNSGTFPGLMVALARTNGGSAANIDPAFTFLKHIKPNVLTFYSNQDQPANLMANGSAWIGVWTADRVLNANRGGANIGIAYPKEGTTWYGNPIGVSKGTHHLEMALAFANFALSKTINKNYCITVGLAPTNKYVKMPKSMARVFPPPSARHNPVKPDWAQVAKRIPDWTKRMQREIIGS